MSELNRRAALSGIAFGGVSALAGCAGVPLAVAPSAPAQPAAGTATIAAPVLAPASAFAGTHALKPLPFAAKSLRGLSEAMIVSHHQNNYGGAVRNLNRTEQELGRVNAETPPFIVSALRERELTYRNSKLLHEAYFGNLGGDGKRSGSIETALVATYGASSRWEEHFRATGLGLGGGSGWVILALELDTGALRTIALSSHTQSLASGFPLLAMDMYEHSYQIDFGAATARYVDAFFANIQWDEVNRRFELGRRAALALSQAASL